VGVTTNNCTSVIPIRRSSASVAAYEDTLDDLSESDREVTALIFAVAGSLTTPSGGSSRSDLAALAFTVGYAPHREGDLARITVVQVL